MSLSTFALRMEKGDTIIIDKEKGRLQIYPETGNFPKLKITSKFDILALRDLLIDAYPLEVKRSKS